MSHLTPVPSDPDALQAWLQQLTANPFAENVEIELPDPPETARELTVEVTLRGAEPPIWRRLVIPGDLTLDAFHDVLQIAMGWTDSHLHRFFPGGDEAGPYFVTDYDVEEGDAGTPEETVRVDQLLREPGDRLRYEYDFGDGWTHDVHVETFSDGSGDPLPRCTGGAMACPPEDVGGIHGYAEVVAWHRAGRTARTVPPPFKSREQIVDWLPPDFDPDAFDIDDVNLMLRAADVAQALVMGLRPELAELLGQLDPIGSQLALEWVLKIPDEPASSADLTAASHHWRVLLDAVGSGVKLSSAGYLPPAVVQQVFDELGLADRWFGKGNREDHTPPIAQLRAMAQELGLLRKAKGVLAPTAKARAVGSDAAAMIAFVLDRLPLGRADVEQEAGWFALLGVAAGESEKGLRDGIALLLASRGWRLEDGGSPDSFEAYFMARPTLRALNGPLGDVARLDAAPPAWLHRIAALGCRP